MNPSLIGAGSSASPTTAAETDAKPASSVATDAEKAEKKPQKGHGRNGADAYAGAEKIVVRHESLQPGDPCPKCEQGTVYETARPGVLVRIVGQSPIQAKIYELQKLRCNLCGIVFTAKTPEGVGTEKYDATSGSMIALLKYGNGMPFNRMEGLQENLGVPLPASTQWDIVHEKAERIEPAFNELIRHAADGEILHNDDTTVKILEMMGERAKQQAFAEDAASDDAEEPAKKTSERRGIFTSGIVSLRSIDGWPDRRIALFFSGRNHAGENLEDVLSRRAETLSAPIQMCDALSRNLPGDLKTIVAHCMAHGRRRFVEVADYFPDECRYVLESLSVIYRNDAIARAKTVAFRATALPPSRERSDDGETSYLAWSAVGGQAGGAELVAGRGDFVHAETLGASDAFPASGRRPLDNNICEQALKRAILHRKNALFYKTCNGAHVGDIFMSLIHTCALCGANPFDYLTEIDRHAAEMSAAPQNWMPWNYRQTIAVSSLDPAISP